jgi:CheY-like chemotaxis protein
MPGLNGVELTKELRSIPEYRKMVILMVTSNDQQGDEIKAKAAGCDGYLLKPIDTQALPGIIAGYLREGRGTGQSGNEKK